jgi:hypothetical protein
MEEIWTYISSISSRFAGDKRADARSTGDSFRRFGRLRAVGFWFPHRPKEKSGYLDLDIQITVGKNGAWIEC